MKTIRFFKQDSRWYADIPNHTLEENEMVLILGKGNETYEKLKDETIYFNDIEEAYNAVVERKLKEGVTN